MTYFQKRRHLNVRGQPRGHKKARVSVPGLYNNCTTLYRGVPANMTYFQKWRHLNVRGQARGHKKARVSVPGLYNNCATLYYLLMAITIVLCKPLTNKIPCIPQPLHLL